VVADIPDVDWLSSLEDCEAGRVSVISSFEPPSWIEFEFLFTRYLFRWER
jgi:hypothetical protein